MVDCVSKRIRCLGLQVVAVRCSASQCVAEYCSELRCVLQCIVVSCVVCCSVLQRVAGGVLSQQTDSMSQSAECCGVL